MLYRFSLILKSERTVLVNLGAEGAYNTQQHCGKCPDLL